MPHGLMPSRAAAMGRGGDTEVGHLTEGEVVVPRQLAAEPDLREQLIMAFEKAGVPMGRYEVGGTDDSRNPETGMREYFGRMGGRAGGGVGQGTGSTGAERGGDSQVGRDAASDTGRPGGGPSGNPDAGATAAGRVASAERDAGRGALSAVGRDPRNVGEQMAANLAMGGDAGWFSQERRDLPMSRKDKVNSVAARVLGAIFGVGGWAHTDQARAWNAGRMAAGEPHHNPETGVWTSRDWRGLDPRTWHPGPSRPTPEGHGGGGEPGELPPIEDDEAAATGFHTPPPNTGPAVAPLAPLASPAVTPPAEEPSWVRYLNA